MQVNLTLRATIALQKAHGELKNRLENILGILEADGDLSAEQVRMSPSRPDVCIVSIDDYRLFIQREAELVQVLDIVPHIVAYR